MKKLFLESILTLVALSVVSGASYAQPAQDTPESVAKAYFAAMQAGYMDEEFHFPFVI